MTGHVTGAIRTVGRAPDRAVPPAQRLPCTDSAFTGPGTAIGLQAMPTRSPGNVLTGTIQDLGLPGRAVSALTRAGVTSIEALAVLTRRDLAAINGLGPGMIAAIRLVVPEPPASAPGSGAAPGIHHGQRSFPVADPAPEPAEKESPAAPAIPSFASLRDPRRHTAVDLLVPEAPPVASANGPTPAGAPRPAEYADLLRLGVRLVRASAGLPRRLALWSVRQPVRCLSRRR